MRIELIHPLLVHFPIALLLTGTGLRILAYFFRKHLLFTSWVVLGLGGCFAWLAILGGELAADIVEPNLCDPTILKHHSLFAYTTAYLFTLALLLDLANALQFQKKLLYALCPILFVVCAFVLMYVGYLGGALVYEQGAAVEKCCAPKQQ